MNSSDTTVGPKKLEQPPLVPAFLLNDLSLGCPFCNAPTLEDISKHKNICRKYQEISALFSSDEVEGDSTTKKRGCPITEPDEDESSDDDKENFQPTTNSSRSPPKKSTKRITVVAVASPSVIGPDDPPYLYVPGVGKGSPVNTFLGGCRVCGVTACRTANSTIFDHKMDYDDKLSVEYDPDGTIMSRLPLSSYYRCATLEEKQQEGVVVRDAIDCLAHSNEMFCSHKYMGDPAFEAKLREYYRRRLPVTAVDKFWIPLRLASKRVMAYHRMEGIRAIRNKVLGEYPNYASSQLAGFGSNRLSK